MNNYIAWDVESALIAAGLLAPPLACVTFCNPDYASGIFHWADSACHDYLKDLFENRHSIGVNVAYDLGVSAAQFPDLLPLVFKALFEDRVMCARLNERLIHLSQGQLDGSYDSLGVYKRNTYSLAAMHERYGFGVLPKDEHRLSYGEYRKMPIQEWPEGAVKYAIDDAIATQKVWGAQTAYEGVLGDAFAQARAAFALHLMSCRGVITDRAACQAFIDKTKTEIENARILCVSKGLVSAAGKREMKYTRTYMEKVCVERGLELKQTDKGATCLDAEACRDTGDEVLKAYATYTSSNTLLKKAETLLLGATTPLQTSFETLLETGRTSSRAPMAPMIGDNLQNIRRAPGMRECFIPRPGFVFCSIDFDMMELHAVAQVRIWKFGSCKLADAINAGKDVHSILAAEMLGCSYDEMNEGRKVKGSKYAIARHPAKMGNFLLWGGGGWKKFHQTVNASARKPEEMITEETGQQVKATWLRTWGARNYLDWISELCGSGLATIKQFVTERVRANTNYTQTANTFFQGLAADAAKAGLLPLSYECYVDKTSPLYGSRPVLFLHDEVFFELKADRAHDAAFRARDIMLREANRFVPDVPATATPCLMDRWSKDAETIYDKDGRLIPWTPEEKKEAA